MYSFILSKVNIYTLEAFLILKLASSDILENMVPYDISNQVC